MIPPETAVKHCGCCFCRMRKAFHNKKTAPVDLYKARFLLYNKGYEVNGSSSIAKAEKEGLKRDVRKNLCTAI